MSNTLISPLGEVKSSRLGIPLWVTVSAMAVAAHGIGAYIWLAPPPPEPEPTIEESAIEIMLTPPGPPPVEEAAPPPPPPPPEVEIPDLPPEEPTTPTERAEEAPPVEATTAPPPPAPPQEVRRASTVAQARPGSPDPRFDAEQYAVYQQYIRDARLAYVAELRYPRRAQRDAIEGTGVLRISVSREGRILEWTLISSTGHVILDREIERSAGRVNRLEALPREIERDVLLIDVPVAFQVVY